jgi:hypothetical protein
MCLSYRILRDRFLTVVVLLAPFFLAPLAVAGVVSQTGCGYSSGLPLVGTFDGASYHCTSVSGFDTTSITASALTDDLSPYSANGQYQISDSADLDAMIFTSGPVRSGFMEITASSTSEFGYIAEQVGSWSCSGLGSPCYSPGNQYLPLTLGVPLELTIHASYRVDTGSALATISLSLFEARSYTPPFFGNAALYGDSFYGESLLLPGAPVVLLAAPPAPEPASVFLLVAGFAAFWIKSPGIRMLCRGTSAFFRST